MMLSTQTILTSARVACFRECPDYRTTKSLNIGPWRTNLFNIAAYLAHPRANDFDWLVPVSNWSKIRPNYWTTELAYDYTDSQCDVADMMTYFANHVRDALKFDY